jgi:hypothetical protein
MSRINLYTTFYNEKNEVRKNELLSCIQNNLNNPSIASVTVLNEGASVAYLHQSKLKNIPILNDLPIRILSISLKRTQIKMI